MPDILDEAEQPPRHQAAAAVAAPLSARKRGFRDAAELAAPKRDRWVARNQFFHEQDLDFLRFLVPEGLRVLEIGCGTARLLAGLKPAYGVGLDFSPGMIAAARHAHPTFEYIEGDIESAETVRRLAEHGPYDAILLVDMLSYLDDVQETLESLQSLCGPDTRIVIAHHSHLWEPAIAFGEAIGLKQAGTASNYLASSEIANLALLAGFEPLKREWRQLVPKRLLGVGAAINRWIAPLPAIRRLCLRHYVVLRSLRAHRASTPSCSVIIPCRNEEGNIPAAIQRMPDFCPNLEIIFVEGNSKDDTWGAIQRVKEKYGARKIVALKQPGKGKGDAVRAGFDVATGDILMILDADLTVAPEDLPKFYRAAASGAGEFINGTRLIYPMEDEAMRFLNYWANRTFAALFTYLLNQPFSDTLCGTKVLSRRAYRDIARNRSYFGDFDPFGDFDLIFGATKLNLKVVEIPVRYAARRYGTTQISRFAHGWLLLRMVVFAFRKLKAM